jgi:large conductance mechanosensitive channel
MKGFRTFLLRGNVIDLAVAVVIGAAFGAVVAAFVKDLITPLLAAIGGKPDFSGLFFTINNSRFLYGDFINAVLAFVIIAAIIYYLVIVPMNTLIARSRKEPPADPTTRNCPECLSVIALGARRCPYCTAAIEPAAAGTPA